MMTDRRKRERKIANLSFLIVVRRNLFGFGGELFNILDRLFRAANDTRAGDTAAFARHHFDQVAGGFAVRIGFEKPKHRGFDAVDADRLHFDATVHDGVDRRGDAARYRESASLRGRQNVEAGFRKVGDAVCVSSAGAMKIAERPHSFFLLLKEGRLIPETV